MNLSLTIETIAKAGPQLPALSCEGAHLTYADLEGLPARHAVIEQHQPAETVLVDVEVRYGNASAAGNGRADQHVAREVPARQLLQAARLDGTGNKGKPHADHQLARKPLQPVRRQPREAAFGKWRTGIDVEYELIARELGMPLPLQPKLGKARYEVIACRIGRCNGGLRAQAGDVLGLLRPVLATVQQRQIEHALRRHERLRRPRVNLVVEFESLGMARRQLHDTTLAGPTVPFAVATLLARAEPAKPSRCAGPQTIFWPVFAQSARNCSRPLSVSGCLTSALRIPGGTVATSAPIMAASLTWFTVRIEAARMSVDRSW